MKVRPRGVRLCENNPGLLATAQMKKGPTSTISLLEILKELNGGNEECRTVDEW